MREKDHSGESGLTPVKALTPMDVLMDIRDLLRAERAIDMPADGEDARDIPIGAGAGEIPIDTDVQFGYVYIPNCPRDITIYSGNRGELIGSFKQGSFVRFRMPRETGLTIIYSAGAAAQTFTIYVSARNIEINSGEIQATLLPGTAAANRVFASVVTAVATADGASTTAGFFADSAGSNRPAPVYNFVYNGLTFDRLRTPNVFKTVSTAATGTTPAWTPGGGKRFRLMRFKVQVTSNATLAAGAVLIISLLDSVSDMLLTHSVFIPAAAVATNPLLESGWIDLGNGFLSSAANNVLGLSLSAALTAGVVRVILAGTEE